MRLCSVRVHLCDWIANGMWCASRLSSSISKWDAPPDCPRRRRSGIWTAELRRCCSQRVHRIDTTSWWSVHRVIRYVLHVLVFTVNETLMGILKCNLKSVRRTSTNCCRLKPCPVDLWNIQQKLYSSRHTGTPAVWLRCWTYITVFWRVHWRCFTGYIYCIYSLPCAGHAITPRQYGVTHRDVSCSSFTPHSYETFLILYNWHHTIVYHTHFIITF